MPVNPEEQPLPPLPNPVNVKRKKRTLLARLAYCESSLQTCSPAAAQYRQAEISALKDAIECLEWVGGVWAERARLKSIRDEDARKKSRPGISAPELADVPPAGGRSVETAATPD